MNLNIADLLTLCLWIWILLTYWPSVCESEYCWPIDPLFVNPGAAAATATGPRSEGHLLPLHLLTDGLEPSHVVHHNPHKHDDTEGHIPTTQVKVKYIQHYSRPCAYNISQGYISTTHVKAMYIPVQHNSGPCTYNITQDHVPTT